MTSSCCREKRAANAVPADRARNLRRDGIQRELGVTRALDSNGRIAEDAIEAGDLTAAEEIADAGDSIVEVAGEAEAITVTDIIADITAEDTHLSGDHN